MGHTCTTMRVGVRACSSTNVSGHIREWCGCGSLVAVGIYTNAGNMGAGGGHKASIRCSLFEKKGVNTGGRKIAEGRFIKRKSKPKKVFICNFAQHGFCGPLRSLECFAPGHAIHNHIPKNTIIVRSNRDDPNTRTPKVREETDRPIRP